MICDVDSHDSTTLDVQTDVADEVTMDNNSHGNSTTARVVPD